MQYTVYSKRGVTMRIKTKLRSYRLHGKLIDIMEAYNDMVSHETNTYFMNMAIARHLLAKIGEAIDMHAEDTKQILRTSKTEEEAKERILKFNERNKRFGLIIEDVHEAVKAIKADFEANRAKHERARELRKQIFGDTRTTLRD